MSAIGFTLFDTAVGRCGIAWGECGIVGVQLPERHDTATQARLLRRYPGMSEAPAPPAVLDAIEAITGLLRGEQRDLSAIALDMQDVPEFHQRVYATARTIPPGSTLSYGEIAARVGDRNLAREVGEALDGIPVGQQFGEEFTECGDIVAGGECVGVAEIDGCEIHRNRAEDGGELAGGDEG